MYYDLLQQYYGGGIRKKANEDKPNYLVDLGVTSALGAAPMLATTGYARIPSIRKAIYNSDDIAAQNKLYKTLRRLGIDTMDHKNGPAMLSIPTSGSQPPIQTLIKPVGSKPSAGVLAHELGHALNARTIKKLGGGKAAVAHLLTVGPLAMAAALPSGIAHTFNADTDTLGMLGAGGAALTLPRLAEETIASARGAKLMKRLKLKGKWKAFAGLPTYLALPALPMIPWVSRKLQEKFNK